MKTIVIDGLEMSSRDDVHTYLAKRFSLPVYYGKNLDALHDCLCDIKEPTNIIIYHRYEFERSLQLYAERLLQVLRHSADENPNLAVYFDIDSIPNT